MMVILITIITVILIIKARRDRIGKGTMTTCLKNILNYHRIFFMPSSSSSTPEEICMCYDNETIEVCTREGRGRKLIKI